MGRQRRAYSIGQTIPGKLGCLYKKRKKKGEKIEGKYEKNG
jgi:hypothetical protein